MKNCRASVAINARRSCSSGRQPSSRSDRRFALFHPGARASRGPPRSAPPPTDRPTTGRCRARASSARAERVQADVEVRRERRQVGSVILAEPGEQPARRRAQLDARARRHAGTHHLPRAFAAAHATPACSRSPPASLPRAASRTCRSVSRRHRFAQLQLADEPRQHEPHHRDARRREEHAAQRRRACR